MSRSDRGLKKFSFPLPRRSRSRLQKPLDNAEDDTDARSIPPSISGSIRPSRHHEEPISKAHEILGTSSSLHTSTPTPTPSLPPPSPGFVSVVISETIAGSRIDDWDSASTADDTGRPPMSKQPSSNVLGRIYSGERKWGSDYSGSSSRLHPQTSNSTLRSHYDAKKSPLSISQQTSDSAIRDRALRRGRTPVLTDKGYDGYVANPVSPVILDEARGKYHKKSKPARLDLSRLFPRPKDSWDQRHGNAMLSPAKMVNSPAALSVNSEYFHHSPSRDWTPQATPNKLQKNRTPTRRQPSPVRIIERDEYDNAKVHVRRPPKGVQHWFDALDEDSDESSEETRQKSAPRAVRSHGASAHNAPVAAHPSQSTRPSTYGSRSQNNMPATYKRDSFALEDIIDVRHLTSPSQYSVNTYHSQTSSRTKESVLAKTNLQDSSVLSFSSSEDEGDSSQFEPTRTFNRQSVDSSDYTGDIVIGRAQTFEMRSPHSRQHSTGKMSTFSTSTNAATIDIMYTPEPPLPTHRYSRNRTYSGGKRASHMRQPSVILEDEDSRPKIAFDEPASPSNRSVMSSRTSASAPQLQTDASQRFMQVTAEEEALLELMRKKRAAMNKLCASQPSASEPNKQQKAASETFNHGHGKSGLSESSPLRVDTTSRNRTSSSVSAPHQPSTRGRSAKVNSVVSASQLRDSSTSDAWSDRNHSPASRGRSPHFMTSTEFSGLHASSPRSPIPAAGAASPTTTDHPSPLPSPLTPARYVSDRDVDVKVADSDISNDLDDMPILDQIVIGAPPESVKSDSSRELGTHRRRRTASSDAEIKFPVPPTSHSFRDLASVSEGSSRPPSIVEPPAPKPQKKAVRHISEVALGSIETRNRQSSPHSAKSHTSSPNSTYINSGCKTRSRHLSPDCITTTPRIVNEDRDSVSEDVLAAWNSLGGTY